MDHVSYSTDDAPDVMADPAGFAAYFSPEAILVVDPALRIRYASPATSRLFGDAPEALVGDLIFDHVHLEDQDSARGAVGEATREDGSHAPIQVRVRHRAGHFIDALVNATTVTRPDGIWMVVCARIVAVVEDVAMRRRRLEHLLREASIACSGAHWFNVDEVVSVLLADTAAVVEAARIDIAWDDEQGSGTRRVAVWAAEGFEIDDQVAGTPFVPITEASEVGRGVCAFVDDVERLALSVEASALVPRGIVAAVEVPIWSLGGPRAVVRCLFRQRRGGWDDSNADLVGLIGATVLSALRRCWAEERTSIRARRDHLTGLANREELHDALIAALAEQRPGGELGVLFIDVDNLKAINDTLGHSAGDELLVEVAEALRGCVRDGDLVSRIGGDEFVVVCRGVGSLRALDTVRRRVERAVTTIVVRGVRGSASVGMVCAGTEESAWSLLERADGEMYRHKRLRKGEA